MWLIRIINYKSCNKCFSLPDSASFNFLPFSFCVSFTSYFFLIKCAHFSCLFCSQSSVFAKTKSFFLVMVRAAVLLRARSSYCSYITMGVVAPRGLEGGRYQRRQLTVYCTWRICCWSAQRLPSHLRLEAAAQAEFLNSPWISSRRRFSIACYIFISCYSWTALISSTSDLQGPLKRSEASWQWWWILPQMLPHPFVEAARLLCSCRWSEQDRFWPPSVAKLFMTMIFPSLPIPGLWMKCQEGWARCSPHTSERAHRPCVRFASGAYLTVARKTAARIGWTAVEARKHNTTLGRYKRHFTSAWLQTWTSAGIWSQCGLVSAVLPRVFPSLPPNPCFFCVLVVFVRLDDEVDFPLTSNWRGDPWPRQV